MVGKLDSNARSWPVLRRSDICTHFLLKEPVLPTETKPFFFFLSNFFPWSNFHLCTKSQVTLLVAESFSVADVYFLIAERSLLQGSPENGG